MFKTLFFTALTFVFFQFSGNAQSHFSKVFTFGNGYLGDGISIQPYEDGYLVYGNTSIGQLWPALAKLDENAVLSWSNVYPAGDSIYGAYPGGTPLIDSGFIYIGYADAGYSSTSDISLMCIERSTQSMIWAKTFQRDSADHLLTILPDGKDAIWMVGSAVQPNDRINLRVTKISKFGDVISDQFYDDYQYYFPGQAQLAADSGLLIATTVRKQGATDFTGVLVKINKNGDLEWNKEFNTYTSYASTNVVTLPNGNIAFGWVKDTLVPPFGYYSPTVFLLDSSGNLMKSYSFDDSRSRYMFSLNTLSNGDIMGFGWGSGGPGSGFSTGGWAFRMNPDGDLLWDRTFRDSLYSEGPLMDGVQLPDNSLLLTGYVRNADGFPGEDFVWMLKLGADGCFGPDCDPAVFISGAKEALIQSNTRYTLVPNPANDYVFLKGFTGVEELTVEIFNQAGQSVKMITGITSGRLFTGDLPSGDYTVKIVLKGNRFAVCRLVKQ